MNVFSYPELYTSLIGWQQYDAIWNVLLDSSLIYLPFVILVFISAKAVLSTPDPHASLMAGIHTWGLKGFGIVMVFLFAGYPLISVNPSVVHFKVPCSGKTASAEHSGTTFDGTLPLPNEVKIPMFWYWVMGTAHAVDSALISGLSCKTNLREMRVQLDLTRIKNPELKNETQDFFNQCFQRSWSKFLHNKSQIQDKNIWRDAQWIGSNYFLSTPGYYDTFKSQQPIPGFPYEADKDLNKSQNHSLWRAPTCKDWWQDSSSGLYQRLIDQFPNGLWDKITSLSTNAKQDAIEHLVSTTFPSGYETTTMQSPAANGFVSKYIGAPIGIRLQEMHFYPTLYMIIQSLPFVQSFILMTIYILLPFLLLFSVFNYRVLFTIAAAIFIVIFWSYLWQLVQVMDNEMLKAMFPYDAIAGASELERLSRMLTYGMYIGFPFLSIAIMAMVTRIGGIGLGVLGSVVGVAEGAGRHAGNMGNAAATSAGSGAVRGIAQKAME